MKFIYEIMLVSVIFAVTVFPQELNNRPGKNNSTKQIQSVEWTALGSGVNGDINAIAVSGNYIYVGGSFSTAGGVSANNIARWNTSTNSWSALTVGVNNGVNGTVYALAVDEGYHYVYVGGSFSTAGGVSVSNIAGWLDDDVEDIHSWNALGSGVNNTVFALAIDNTPDYNYLYVGGALTSAGGISVNHLACYDAGNSGPWSDFFSPGVNGTVYSIVVSGSNVYVGGNFTTAGGITTNCIARCDISSVDDIVWNSLGSGMSGTDKSVYAIKTSSSTIYAGGVFDHAGGQSTNNIAKWDGSNWSALGNGITYSGDSPFVNAISVRDNLVYAAGWFNEAGSVSTANIARWDGAGWSALGSGVNSEAFSVIISGNYIYTGGSFTEAGGSNANHIARIQDSDFFLPVVTTSSITNVSSSSATGGGNVTNDHGQNVTAKGVCWSTSQYPTTADSKTNDGTGTGAFVSSITGLTDGTVYHVRAYATNFYGTSYGSDVSFKTFSSSPGTALSFGGIDDYVNIPDNNALDLTSNYTIESWIKPEAFSSMGGIVSKYQTSGTNGYVLRLTSTGGYDGLTFDGMNTSNGILTAGNWYHIAAVNDGGTRHLYLNGIEHSLTGTGTVSANSDPLCIGVDYKVSGRYFIGDIDEVRIWNVVRTSQEIRENMHRTFDNAESGLVCYWQFNDGSGSSSLADVAGGKNGTLTNMDNTNAWVSSTIPVGGGTSNSSNSFTTGTANLGDEQITTTDDFDNSVNLVCTDIDRSPNTTNGITGNVQNSYCVLKAYVTPGTFSVNITFTLPEGSISESDRSTPSNLKLYRRDSNADGDWSLVVSASSATATTATFNGISSFSQFIIASSSSPMPVELTSFTADINGRNVLLNWQTATEVNNYGFEIERTPLSPPFGQRGETGGFEKIAFVQGHGNSNSPKSYSFTDSPTGGAAFKYRLKQIDFDGQFEYSDVVDVTIDVPLKSVLMQNYPNPFNPLTTINYQLSTNSRVTLKIYDVLGREVETLVNKVESAGNYSVAFDGRSLASGIYFYSISAGSFNAMKKFVLLR